MSQFTKVFNELTKDDSDLQKYQRMGSRVASLSVDTYDILFNGVDLEFSGQKGPFKIRGNKLYYNELLIKRTGGN